MGLLEQVQREQFIILKTRYDPGGGKPTPECFPTGLSELHVFPIWRKSIDKNISFSYWFVIDYCFSFTQRLMITLFFGPEGHMSYCLTPWTFLPSRLSITKLARIQFQHLHLGAVLVPWSSPFTELLCLVSYSPTASRFQKACLSSWTEQGL